MCIRDSYNREHVVTVSMVSTRRELPLVLKYCSVITFQLSLFFQTLQVCQEPKSLIDKMEIERILSEPISERPAVPGFNGKNSFTYNHRANKLKFNNQTVNLNVNCTLNLGRSPQSIFKRCNWLTRISP